MRAVRQCGRGLLGIFPLQQLHTHVNHGSFGSTPSCVQLAHEHVCETIENNPDRFYRYAYYSMVANALQSAAKLIECNSNDVVFVTNATHAVNSALRAVVNSARPKTDVIHFPDFVRLIGNPTPSSTYFITLDTIYCGCAAAVKRLCLETDSVEVRIPLPCYTPADVLLDKVRRVLSVIPSNAHNSVFLFDHICSERAIVYPVNELCALCRAHGVVSVVDGAHAIGQVPISVRDMECDFYTTNCHKWLYCPRGVALMYVHPSWHTKTRAPIGSSGLLEGLQAEFRWQGTRDLSPWLCVPAAVEFIESLGGLCTVRQYMYTLRKQACDYLTNAWQTELYCQDDDRLAAMALVKLPSVLSNVFDPAHPDVCKHMWYIYDKNYALTGSFICLEGELFIRISCAVYNGMEDYARLCEATLDLVKICKERGERFSSLRDMCANFDKVSHSWKSPMTANVSEEHSPVASR